MQVSRSLDILGSQTGIPKGLKKVENSGGEEGLAILDFGGQGGVKILSLESPIIYVYSVSQAISIGNRMNIMRVQLWI